VAFGSDGEVEFDGEFAGLLGGQWWASSSTTAPPTFTIVNFSFIF
jgi:hypothetical protein